MVLPDRSGGQHHRAPELVRGALTRPYDLLIEHGTVVDGTGAPGVAGTVGVRDGRLEILREAPAPDVPVQRRIDAAG